MTPVDTLAQLYSWLGPRAVLLPVFFGTKKPVFDEWQTITFEITQEASYQDQLKAAIERKGNIGVRLTEGLVSVDVDIDGLINAFAARAPFSDTLRSKGRRGCNFWFRMIGAYPNGQNVYNFKNTTGKKVGEWRCGPGAQTVIWGEHESSTTKKPIQYQRLVSAPVVEVPFAELPWPEGIVLPWEEKQAEPQPDVQCGGERTDLDKRIHSYLDSIPGAVSGQDGHGQTFKAACALINGWALSVEEAMPYLLAYNQKCEPPWTDKELTHKLNEAVKVTHEKPRGHLIQPSTVYGLKKKTAPVSAEEVIDWENYPANLPNNSANSPDFSDSIAREAALVKERIEISTNSTKPPPPYTQTGYIHPCIYPTDSILSDYMELAHEVSESADPFLIGACLPGIGALLGRRIRFPFGHEIQFPNLFNMLAGPPGTRKSSAIEFSNGILRGCLPKENWMSKRFSVETLFDEYDHTRGGSPDKLWVYSDAKPILTDWKKTSYGERVAAEVLDLYDCRGLTENYRRNATKKSPQTKRYIPQTSTSLVSCPLKA